jgi:hypothetical protein
MQTKTAVTPNKCWWDMWQKIGCLKFTGTLNLSALYFRRRRSVYVCHTTSLVPQLHNFLLLEYIARTLTLILSKEIVFHLLHNFSGFQLMRFRFEISLCSSEHSSHVTAVVTITIFCISIFFYFQFLLVTGLFAVAKHVHQRIRLNYYFAASI